MEQNEFKREVHLIQNNMNEIERIYVLGHSLNLIDKPYFRKIISLFDDKIHNQKTLIFFSCLEESDKDIIKRNMKDILFTKNINIEKMENLLKEM